MSNVGKATDGMLDTISELRKNRNATLDWISTYRETGVLTQETADWLELVLKGE